MNTSNKYDSIESLIFESGLRISSIAVHKPQDLMIVFLNSGASILVPISKYNFFSNATQEQLSNYILIADGVGINWPELDEDLSLKGFLKDELKKLVMIGDEKPSGNTSYAMAS